MIIWSAMLVPVVMAIVLFVFFSHRTAWWEFALPFLLSLVCCSIFKAIIERSQTSDTEYWTSAVLSADYYEAWTERVSCRHPQYDSKGNFTGYAHLYDEDYHPPYWVINDNSKQTLFIDKNTFESLAQKFGNRVFVHVSRWSQSSWGDGNRYTTTWENRVIASHNVFNFPEVADRTPLYDYPKISYPYTTPFILGEGGPTKEVAERKLAIWNALHGPTKQCRLIFCVFRDQPFQVALDQESVWQGGNKNEFIVMIGVDSASEHIAWSHVASWTEVDQLKVAVKDLVRNQGTLDLVKLVDVVGPIVEERFERKHFRDFNYITVEPPLWGIVLTFVVTTVFNVGLSVWIVQNDIDE